MVTRKAFPTLLLTIFLLGGCGLNQPREPSSTQTQARTSVERAREILKAVNSIAEVASAHGSQSINDAVRTQIHGTVDRIKDPKDLKAMALMLRPLTGYADDFDVGFWRCVDLLAEDTSDRAVAALAELNLEIRPESGDKQQFDEAIEHQREKRAAGK